MEVVEIMYGPNWEASIPLLEVLAFSIYARGVNSVHAPLMSAAGRSDLLMRSTTINTVATIAMILLGGALGSLQTLATCVVIAYTVELAVPAYLSARRCLHMGTVRYFLNLLPDVGVELAVVLLAHLVPWGDGERVPLARGEGGVRVCAHGDHPLGGVEGFRSGRRLGFFDELDLDCA